MSVRTAAWPVTLSADVNDEETALYPLPDWWIARAPKIIDAL